MFLRILTFGALAILFLVGTFGIGIYTDWLWFQSLGKESIYLTILGAQVGLFLIGALVFFVILMASMGVAVLLARGLPRFLPLDDMELPPWVGEIQALSGPFLRAAFIGGAVFISALMGGAAAGNWQVILKYLNASPFGISDPLFNTDIGFYVFTLPFYRFAQSWLTTAMVLVLLATAAVYAIYAVRNLRFSLERFVLPLTAPIKAHLSVLGASIVLLLAWNYRLDIYGLLYSSHGLFTGAAYTDVNAQWPVLNLLIAVAIVTALLLLVNIFRPGLLLPGIGVGLWVVVLVLGQGIYPGVVQNFQVAPDEFNREQPYIKNNIEFTRKAYALDRIEEKDFPAEEAPTVQDIVNNPDTINNVRFWDTRPLLDTFNQIQAIRLYYDFLDIDVDRYKIEGRYRQVMLSARELSIEKLQAEAQRWITQRLQFTHGYGLAMVPVTEFTTEGLPRLFVKDVPPIGAPGVKRPELYYSEKASDYVMVKTRVQEFDYAKGEENVYTTYQGNSGVDVGSYINKLAFALRFSDVNIALPTSPLTSESKILFYRKIQDRVLKLAPFLFLDRDPYLVVLDDGRLVWIQDAYTYTDRYPYSTSFRGRFNYIRNSIKAVIDAYEGTVTLYVAEPDDPIIKTYQAIFPALFTPMTDMSPDLQAHIRYPEDLFFVQADMLRVYQMRDARVFYNKEDVWAVPSELYEEQKVQMDPYYIIMRPPGEPQEEFILILPFTPTNKDNMIGWLAARSDQPNYGKLVMFKFPKDRLIFGPMQIESRINQDPTISAQITLWSQAGSRVIRGNLLVIPIGNSLLYVEPLYLRSREGQIPELKRVIVVKGNSIAMEPSLGDSLVKLFGTQALAALSVTAGPTGGPTVVSPPTTPGAPTGPAISADMMALIRSANDHYLKAQDKLKAGDWAGYGEEIKALEQDLKKLQETSGTPTGR